MIRRRAQRISVALGVAVIAVLPLAAAQAESRGAYVHGELRQGDEKLIACRGLDLAVTLSKSVNLVLVGMLDALTTAVDDAERLAIYQERLYPSPAWQALVDAIEDQVCDLAETADHTSRRTILRGPDSLGVLKASHSVVESDMHFLDTQASTTVYIITTEAVPPAE